MKKNNKGFTLAEMLIVVAIIGVLIAILVPTFTTQLRKARAATDAANIRSKYAEMVANGTSSYTLTGLKGNHSWEGISNISGWTPSGDVAENATATISASGDYCSVTIGS